VSGTALVQRIRDSFQPRRFFASLAKTPIQIGTAYQDKNRTLARCG
jgi:hypothetical protein